MVARACPGIAARSSNQLRRQFDRELADLARSTRRQG
jgi:hypothetical protein